MIKFEVHLPVIAEDADRCHPDCQGRYSDHDGNMLCHYFDDDIGFGDERCKGCKEYSEQGRVDDDDF